MLLEAFAKNIKVHNTPEPVEVTYVAPYKAPLESNTETGKE